MFENLILSDFGSRYTAEIKVGNKQLKANGGWSRNQAINDVHVPIKGK